MEIELQNADLREELAEMIARFADRRSSEYATGPRSDWIEEDRRTPFKRLRALP